jgi:flagellar biosynthesis anti-sigma factor FlgM
MVGISGLGGIPEPKSERPASNRTERTDASARASAHGKSASSDDVAISSEAQAAAEVSRIVALSRSQEEIRAEKVQAARDRLLAGSYRDPEVVAQIAEKLLKYMA